MQIREVFDRKRFVFLDGGMGTMLQASGLKLGAGTRSAARAETRAGRAGNA